MSESTLRAEIDKLHQRIDKLENDITRQVSQRLSNWNKALDTQLKALEPKTWMCAKCGGDFPASQPPFKHFPGGIKTVGPLCGPCLAGVRAKP
jgi:hypothetical protein